MQDYKLGRAARRCSVTGETLAPGSWYYSVIKRSDDDLTRVEISASAWQSPPDGALAYWKRQIPPPGPVKMVPAPPEVLLDLLREMHSFAERSDTRYLLALWLMRRRLVEPVDGADSPDHMRLRLTSTGETLDIEVRTITAERAEILAQQLSELTMVAQTDD